MKRQELANIMSRAERFTLSNGTDELNIKREDITNDLLALANGFKAIGGGVHIVQTLDIKAISFDLSERNYAYDFFSFAMQYTTE